MYFIKSGIDFSSLVISIGDLQPASMGKLSKDGAMYTISWSAKTISSLYDNDYARLFVINDDCSSVYAFMDRKEKRLDASLNVEIKDLKEGENLHFYLFFENNGAYSYSYHVCSSL
jgi:hypothetical protein